MGPKQRYYNWDPGAILLQPSVRRMGAEAFGGLMSLVLEAMVSPDGWLPSDEEELRLLARLSPKSYEKYAPLYKSLMVKSDETGFSFDFVQESYRKTVAKSEQAQAAAEARWQDSRKGESTDQADAKHQQSGGKAVASADASEREEKKREDKKRELSQSVGDRRGGGYGEEFESFWGAWKALGGKTSLNKSESHKAWLKAIKRGASAEDIMGGVVSYERYLAFREKGGKTDVRDFVPMPETWLNQNRYGAEYPEEVAVAIIGEPVSGRDFYWRSWTEGTGNAEYVGKFTIINGEKTEEPFSLKAWRERQK